MEEEKMKKLEDLIQRCKDCKFATCEQCEINWNDIQALEFLLKAYKQDEKMIDLIVNTIVSDKKILSLICKRIINKTDDECNEQNLLCDDCIKEYFRKKCLDENKI